MTKLIQFFQQKSLNPGQFIKNKLENLEIKEAQTARRILNLIPGQCPFAREIQVFGKVMFRIPALCKFNPLYDQLMELRFRALCFLADSCGEDVTSYCCN